jgi:hypothetical protein
MVLEFSMTLIIFEFVLLSFCIRLSIKWYATLFLVVMFLCEKLYPAMPVATARHFELQPVRASSFANSKHLTLKGGTRRHERSWSWPRSGSEGMGKRNCV